MNLVRMYVDNLHVATSNKKVIRGLWDRLKKHPENMTLDKKQDRKELYKIALQYHRENFELYRDVMSGNI